MGTGSRKQDVFEGVLYVIVFVDLHDLVDEDERSLARGANARPNDILGRMKVWIDDFPLLLATSGSLAITLAFWEL